MSFLALNAVAALLPALVLQPLANRHGLVRVHTICLAIMAAGFACVYFFVQTAWSLYVLMALMGIGWAAIISLTFAIMSQSVDQSRIGLYMGVFNLSIVLPQLVVSLGVGTFVAGMADKGSIFLIGAVSLALSALGLAQRRQVRQCHGVAGCGRDGLTMRCGLLIRVEKNLRRATPAEAS